MSKILKLGFVLGGGVSLGSFSAGALAETLKQYLLFATYTEESKDAQGNIQRIKKPYDNIQIDVLSGASAGSISLAIMLRALVNPYDQYKILGYTSSETLLQAIEQKVFAQYGEIAYKLKHENLSKWQNLLALQIMQEVQHKLWVEALTMDKLLGVGTHYKKLDDMVGFIDRSIIESLATDAFTFKTVSNRLANKASILSDRVLFACALSNLEYTLDDKSLKFKQNSENKFLDALKDSTQAKVHSEVRIFDINFKKIDEKEAHYYPLKWVQYHAGEDLLVEQKDHYNNTYAKFIRPIDSNEIWREITATTIASAAFPLAFEPVVLTRYKYEYGEKWAPNLGNSTKHAFTYVDGGMFNNEPIEEAFNLAAYLDANFKDAGQINFDRKIIFIDPNISANEEQLTVNVHNQFGIARSFLSNKPSIASKSSLMRMTAQLPHLVTALLNQSKQLGMDEIFNTIENFTWRKKQRALLKSIMLEQMPQYKDAVIIAQRNDIQEKLKEVRLKLDWPIHMLQIQNECMRIAQEEKEYLKDKLPLEYTNDLLASLNDFIYNPQPTQNAAHGIWMYILALLQVDIMLNLIGKYEHVKIIGIAPFDFYKNDYSILTLPGSGLSGFAGFTNKAVSDYEIQYGQYCAYRILSELEEINKEGMPYPLPQNFNPQIFDSILRSDLERALMKRLKELVPKGITATMLPLVEGFLQDKVSSFVEKNLYSGEQKQKYEFRIRVGKELYALRGFDKFNLPSNQYNLEAVKVKNDFYLLTYLYYDKNTQKWSGYNQNNQQLYIDKVGLFENKPALIIDLPTMNNSMHFAANPIFILDVQKETNWALEMHITGDKWHFYSEIIPLDESLWGDDTLKKMMDKLENKF